MSRKKKKEVIDEEQKDVTVEEQANAQDVEQKEETPESPVDDDTSEKKAEEDSAKPKEEELSEEEKLKKQLAEVNDKYLRLSAEFDNYRKRTLKERMELIKNAGESILVSLLPVVDNFERAMKSIEDAKEVDAIKEGIELIYNNFITFLNQRGVKEIGSKDTEFDLDKHEAVTKIPAPDKKSKGKVIDVIEKGYYLNEKVIRYSKVVIGE